MSLCPVCNKEFQNLKLHVTRYAKKDKDHKKLLTVEQKIEVNTENKVYKQGDIVSFKGKGEFEVIEDLGHKLVVRRKGSNLVKLTVKKERL
jgi:hydrogenase maturation factor HypF (carbamoyltransferase family)